MDGALRAGNTREIAAREEKNSSSSPAGRHQLGRETKGPLGDAGQGWVGRTVFGSEPLVRNTEVFSSHLPAPCW